MLKERKPWVAPRSTALASSWPAVAGGGLAGGRSDEGAERGWVWRDPGRVTQPAPEQTYRAWADGCEAPSADRPPAAETTPYRSASTSPVCMSIASPAGFASSATLTASAVLVPNPGTAAISSTVAARSLRSDPK